MNYTWTGRLELLGTLRPITTRHQQCRPYVWPGQASEVTTVAWPMASKGWRLELEQGRRRPATNVTVPGTATAGRKKEAATRRGHSPTAIRQGRQSDDSSVTLSTQRRHTRQPVHLRNSSVTLCRKTHSDSSNKRLLWLLLFTTNISYSTTRAQFQYTSTRLLTLTDSQTINTTDVHYTADCTQRLSLSYCHVGMCMLARGQLQSYDYSSRPRCCTTALNKRTNCD